MTGKTFLLICAQVFLIQSIHSQCLGRGRAGPLAGPYPGSLAAPFAGPLASPLASRAVPGLGPALGYDCAGVASTGGGFPVTSASPIAPTGVTIVSENQIEGALTVGGNLPLLGSVSVEGAFPTAGAGAVSYGCGSGEVIITAESPITTGILTPGPVAPAPALGTFGSLGRPGFSLSLGAGLTPGLLGGRTGLASGIGRGCGCGGLY